MWLSINDFTSTDCEETPLATIYQFANKQVFRTLQLIYVCVFFSFISGEELKAVMLTLGEVTQKAFPLLYIPKSPISGFHQSLEIIFSCSLS